jgi:hypothetical protein
MYSLYNNSKGLISKNGEINPPFFSPLPDLLFPARVRVFSTGASDALD